MSTPAAARVAVELPVFAWMGILALVDEALAGPDGSVLGPLGSKVLRRASRDIIDELREGIGPDALSAILEQLVDRRPAR
jgi:hypothetical protein